MYVAAVVEYGRWFDVQPGPTQATLSHQLLTYCVLVSTKPLPLTGREISSIIPSVLCGVYCGLQDGGMFAGCTAGPSFP